MGLFDIFKKKKTKKRKFEAASKGKRLSGWNTSGGDANAALDTSLKSLRDRSRDLRRNSAYARRAIDVTTSNVIGKGISTQSSDVNTNINFQEWVESKSFDYQGRNNLKAMQRLIMDAVHESGEVLIRRRVDASLKYPFQYQVLESDFLDTTKTISVNGNKIIQGIEFNSSGKILGYHLFENHPGSIDTDFSLTSNFVDASEIKHIYRQERPGQVRGIPWLSSVIIRMKDLGDFEDAQLVRQKIASCFTAFVQDISADCMDEDSESGSFGEILEPGIIEELPPGKTVTFADPPSVENYKEFTSSQIRAIAMGLGLSFESFSGDLSETNYSSGRKGHLEMTRNIDSWRQQIIIDQMLDEMVDDFILMSLLLGFNVDKKTFSHTPPMREMVDPTKELPAMILAVRAGLSSRSETIRAMGKDAAKVYEQLDEDNKLADSLDLILDSDPRYTNSNGKIHEVKTDEENNQDK